MSSSYEITKNLNSREVACPCCGAVIFDRKFVEYLQMLRDFMQVPFVYDKGGFYRCEFYNYSLPNSSPTSRHKKGLAADILTHGWNARMVWKFVKFAQDLGMSIGIYSAHIHVDLRKGNPVFFYGTY